MRYYIPDQSLRDDIYVESLLDFIEAVRQGKYDDTTIRSIRAYLCGIYKNKVFKWLREGSYEGRISNGKEIREIQVPIKYSDEEAMSEIFTTSFKEKIKQIFYTIPEKCQKALDMCTLVNSTT